MKEQESLIQTHGRIRRADNKTRHMAMLLVNTIADMDAMTIVRQRSRGEHKGAGESGVNIHLSLLISTMISTLVSVLISLLISECGLTQCWVNSPANSSSWKTSHIAVQTVLA